MIQLLRSLTVILVRFPFQAVNSGEKSIKSIDYVHMLRSLPIGLYICIAQTLEGLKDIGTADGWTGEVFYCSKISRSRNSANLSELDFRCSKHSPSVVIRLIAKVLLIIEGVKGCRTLELFTQFTPTIVSKLLKMPKNGLESLLVWNHTPLSGWPLTFADWNDQSMPIL